MAALNKGDARWQIISCEKTLLLQSKFNFDLIEKSFFAQFYWTHHEAQPEFGSVVSVAGLSNVGDVGGSTQVQDLPPSIVLSTRKSRRARQQSLLGRHVDSDGLVDHGRGRSDQRKEQRSVPTRGVRAQRRNVSVQVERSFSVGAEIRSSRSFGRGSRTG